MFDKKNKAIDSARERALRFGKAHCWAIYDNYFFSKAEALRHAARYGYDFIKKLSFKRGMFRPSFTHFISSKN